MAKFSGVVTDVLVGGESTLRYVAVEDDTQIGGRLAYYELDAYPDLAPYRGEFLRVEGTAEKLMLATSSIEEHRVPTEEEVSRYAL